MAYDKYMVDICSIYGRYMVDDRHMAGIWQVYGRDIVDRYMANREGWQEQRRRQQQRRQPTCSAEMSSECGC